MHHSACPVSLGITAALVRWLHLVMAGIIARLAVLIQTHLATGILWRLIHVPKDIIAPMVHCYLSHALRTQ